MYCAQSSKWGLFGRNTRSAIRGTSSLKKSAFSGKSTRISFGSNKQRKASARQMLRTKDAGWFGQSRHAKKREANTGKILFYVLRSLLRVGTLRTQYSKCHPRHFFISPTRKRPLKKLYKGITKNTLNNNKRMCMRVLS